MRKQKRQKFSRKQDVNRILASFHGAEYSRFVLQSGKPSRHAKGRETVDMNARFRGYRKMMGIKQKPPVKKVENN